jgi:hypothetical protein
MQTGRRWTNLQVSHMESSIYIHLPNEVQRSSVQKRSPLQKSGRARTRFRKKCGRAGVGLSPDQGLHLPQAFYCYGFGAVDESRVSGRAGSASKPAHVVVRAVGIPVTLRQFHIEADRDRHAAVVLHPMRAMGWNMQRVAGTQREMPCDVLGMGLVRSLSIRNRVVLVRISSSVVTVRSIGSQTEMSFDP